MDQKTVDILEEQIESAIEEILERMGNKHPSLCPNRQIMHLMAKAAVTVLEAATEGRAEA